MYKGYRYIDSDAHVLEPQDLWENYLDPAYRDRAPRHFAGYENDPPTFHVEVVVDGQTLPNFPFSLRGKVLPGLEEAYGDFTRNQFLPRDFEKAMVRTGIDRMVVYPTAGLYMLGVPTLDAPTATAYCRAYNTWLHDFCVATGDRVVGAAVLDIRDPELAAREARRAVKELGFKSTCVNPEPNAEHPLHDPYYDPLWNELVELDVPLGLHVGAGTGLGQVGTNYFPLWGAGRGITAFALGNMIASLSLVTGGVLERHPKLRVVHLESGAGWAAFWLERLGAGVAGAQRAAGGKVAGLSLHPMDYFRRQCFISADPDDPGIKQVFDTLGDDVIVTATDFGHPEGRGYIHALDYLIDMPNISDQTRRKIMWDNPARLYKID
jgi:predicted TIM-barrel fold metal-dependent hydrolase